MSVVEFQEFERSYSGSRSLLREAALSMDVHLTAQEDIDWRDLLDGAHLVDHLLDAEGLDIVRPMRKLVPGSIDPIYSPRAKYTLLITFNDNQPTNWKVCSPSFHALTSWL